MSLPYNINIIGMPAEPVDAGGWVINNLAAPVTNTDAANMQYVNTQINTKDEVSEIINYATTNNITNKTLDNIINAGNSGIIFGCVPSVNNADINITEGLALIRSTKFETGKLFICKIESNSISPTTGDNYICLNYNVSGGLLSMNTPNQNSIIEICKVNNDVCVYRPA